MKTPAELEGIAKNSTVFIIGTGPSASVALKHKHQLREVFDRIIVINKAVVEFDEVADFHMVPEQDAYGMYEVLNNDEWPKMVPRIINAGNVGCVSKDLNVFGCLKCDEGLVSYRSYGSGFAEAYDSVLGEVGTAMLQSLHLACIIGASRVFIIGGEFAFGASDHFYTSSTYSDLSGGIYEKVEVEAGDRCFKTMRVFALAAQHLNRIIERLSKEGIEVWDLSGGLLTSAYKSDLESVLKGVV